MIAASISSADVRREAAAAGFDLCGIAPAANHVELRFLREWLARGYGGDMHYLQASLERRSDVRHVLPTDEESDALLDSLFDEDDDKPRKKAAALAPPIHAHADSMPAERRGRDGQDDQDGGQEQMPHSALLPKRWVPRSENITGPEHRPAK